MVGTKFLTLPLYVLILNFCIMSVYWVGSKSINVSVRTLKNVICNYEMKWDGLFNVYLKNSFFR